MTDREYIQVSCFITGYSKEPGGTLTISPRKLVGHSYEVDDSLKLMLPSGILDDLKKYYRARAIPNVTVFVLKEYVERRANVFEKFV